ncbi:MAG: tRNA (adenosine(37)-N6)-threonylcarbamoyltransferase complex dimerization subunit type 1 TsaB [Bacteroidia bacterium]|nr:tRNA (adenosine(37)-N6)-threonylcarbamoyltransferase complex dimerization subunit type 1 TsaB [Bacteroidia bacterium]
MALLLHIETATKVCSIALSNENEIIGIKETNEQKSCSNVITVFINDLLIENEINPKELDAIVVSQGPGSYTGLRIGVSTAKGLCYSLDKPLIAINTLESMANGIIKETEITKFLLCPMIDARRMEVFTALFDNQLKQIESTSAKVLDKCSYLDQLKNNSIIFFGDGCAKFQNLISDNNNAKFIEGYELSASSMVELALEKFKKSKFEDVAYFEPFYLKEFKGVKPKQPATINLK